MSTSTELWIRTDETEDVAASLRHALKSLSFVEADDQAWKWVALALHSALQGACVCHLVTTASPVGAVTERNAKEWLDYFEASRIDPKLVSPQTYLMTLPDLLKTVRKPRSAGDASNPEGVTLTDSELEWLKHFHDVIRNQFIHFEPLGWSIEVSGIPKVGVLIARIIREILDMGWAFRHQELDWHSAVVADLDSLVGSAQLNA